MTGKYALSLGLTDEEIGASKYVGLPLDETTLADVLKDNGYTNYIIGKWNLGNSSPRYLPTARGFDYHFGYLDGFTSYWSKYDPNFLEEYRDMMYSDSKCYYQYDSDDIDHYSTHLYQDKAVAVINEHDYDKGPMFLYLSFQAVHGPFKG